MDFTGIELGRPVATPDQIFSVIRAELRFASIYGAGLKAACVDKRIFNDDELRLQDGADQAVHAAVRNSFMMSAIKQVTDWARDEALVYDRAKIESFIAFLIDQASLGLIPWAEIDY